jgi:PPOX class probable F420-dependent enzyme
MMTIVRDDVRATLLAGHLAHLTTVNPDGSPHVTGVWIGMDGDDIVVAHLTARHKLRNIRRDPRVVVSLVTGGKNPIGMDEYLVISGRARVVEGGAPALAQRLAETYLGAGVKFPPIDNPPAGYITHISIDRVAGVGPWALPNR